MKNKKSQARRTKASRNAALSRSVEFQTLECRRLFALAITPYNTPAALTQLTDALVTPSTGITVASSSFVGRSTQAGTYTGFSQTSGSTTLAINDGIILTSGLAVNALGPNSATGITKSWGTAGDTDITSLVGVATFDANSITIQFTTDPGIKSVGFDLVFGSDEFPEFVGQFNDAFGAYLDGTQISADGNGNPLSVNNNFFTLDNSGTGAAGKTAVTMDLQYDGLTPELHTQATLNPAITTHTLKLTIADAGDDTVDSGIFLADLAGSTFDPGGTSTGVPAANGAFLFDQSTESAANTDGTVALTVDRINGTVGATTVDYATADGTALAGADYTTTSGTLSFADGQTSAIINVPVIPDAGAAASTAFTVHLSNATGGAGLGGLTSSTVTLSNAQSEAQIASSTYSFANNAGNATIVVTRTGNTTAAGEVDYATTDGTATAGVDYTDTSGTLTFGAGQTSQVITVPLNAGVSGASSTFTVTISNPAGNAVLGSLLSSTVTIHTPPVSTDDSYTAVKNTALTEIAAAGLLINDTDADGNPMTAVQVTGPTHGVLVLNSNGSFTYTPTNGFVGSDSFTYLANDGFFDGNTSTVSITVDTPPVAVVESYIAEKNTALSVIAAAGVLVNDTDAESDPLTTVIVAQPSHGAVTLNANGSFTYTPTNGFAGPDSFTYAANDGTTNGNTATVSIVVDSPPAGVADSYAAAKNTALTVNALAGVLANDTDAEADTLTAVIITGPTNGAVTLNTDGSFTYTPANGYTGPDSFTYNPNDGSFDGNATTVSLTVDTLPVATGESYTAIKNTALTESAANGVLTNDTDADGDPLTAVLVTGPTNGAVTLNADGSFVYTPTNGFAGSDSFTYRANDGFFNGNTVTVALTIDTAPVATGDSYIAEKNTPLTENAAAGVLTNDTDAESDPLTAVIVAGPSNGAVTLNADGSFTYTPTNGFAGPDSFTYAANDGSTNGNTATVSIVVDTPPAGVADSYTAAENTLLTENAAAGVLANDTDAEADPMTAVLVTGPSHGVLALAADGSFTYTPTNGYVGADSFVYNPNDGSFDGNGTTVSLTVDTLPVATGESYTAIKNTALTENAAAGVLVNDTDADGDPITAVLVNGPTHGVIALGADGSFVYTPTNGFAGSDSFTYQANDGFFGGNTATVSLTVDTPPVGVAESYTAKLNTALTVNAAAGVLANDTDAESDPLTAVVVTGPSNGVLALNADGSFTYTPTNGFAGSDSFTYAANDGTANGNTTTVSLTVDTAPVGIADSYAAAKNTALTVNAAAGVLTNDTDAEGDTLTAVLVTGPTHGGVTLNPDGSFTYTPANGYVGPDSFIYNANDGSFDGNATTVSLTVDTLPTAAPESYSVKTNTALTTGTSDGVLANDSDADGDPLTAVLAAGPTHGVLTLNADGSFTYTPTNGFTGSDSFTYSANDGLLNGNTTTVSLTIDTPPVGTDNSYVGLQNSTLAKNAADGVLANDTDAEGDSLTATLVGLPGNGVVNLNADGSFDYTPNAGFFGSDSFAYQPNDGQFAGNTTTVFVTVDRAPAGSADSYTAIKNTALTVDATTGVLANDSDPDGNALTAVLVAGPTNGVLALNADGSFTYTPTTGFAGSDSFTYQANDGFFNGPTTTVSLTVDTLPVAVAESYVAKLNTPLVKDASAGVLANDTDTEGDPLTAVLITGPSNGVLALNADGSFTYTPTTGFTGTDSFAYAANDGTANGNTITVSLAVDTPPVGVVDSYAAAKNTTLTINAAAGVLANDTDANDDALTAVLVTGPTHGAVTLNADGSFTYTPANGYTGPDSFIYHANDGSFDGNATTVSLTVDTLPTAAPESYSAKTNTPLTTNSATGVLANDTDADGNPLTAILVNGPTHGQIALNADGSFTYTPANGFTGSDSFTYSANDGFFNGNTTTVSLTVDTAPVGSSDTYAAIKNTALTVNTLNGVLTNDTDAEGDPLTAALVGNPTHGVVVLNSDGSFTYTPTNGFTGSDSFAYQPDDGLFAGNTTTVSVTVDSLPVGGADSYTAIKNTTLTKNAAAGVLTNDVDADGNPLTAVLVGGPTHGVLALNPDGSFTYTPTAGFTGSDSFTYAANDGFFNGPTTTVSLTVDAAPVTVTDSYVAKQNTPLTVNAAAGVLANDTDAESNPLTAVLVAGPTHGVLNLNPDGSFTYTPTTGYAGADSFTYASNDGSTNGNTATVSLTVDTAPVGIADSYAAIKNTPLTINAASGVLANDTDAESSSLTASLITGPTHGTVTLNANGGFLYTPTNGYTGPDSFVYQANDGSFNGNPTTVSLTVDTLPVARIDSYTAIKNTLLTKNAAAGVLANDTDADGNPLTAVLVNGPLHGVLTLNPNGSFTYTPANGFSGTDSFSYKANDGFFDGNATNVSLTVDVAPVAVPESYVAKLNTPLVVNTAAGVLANDTDDESDPLTAALITGPSHGTLILNPDGSFTYTPTNGYAGSDSFAYAANDGSTNGNTSTVSLTIDTPPVANVDTYALVKNAPLTINAAAGVLANDTDAQSDTLTALLVTGPTHGAVTLNANGSFTYTPTTGYTGADTFTYQANDGSFTGNTTTVSLTVDTLPVATPESYNTVKNATLTKNAAAGVLANDTDADSNPLTAVLITGPTNGVLTLNADGSFIYTPTAGFAGADSFTYAANDGLFNGNTTTVSLNVDAPPVGVADSYVVLEDTPLTKNAAAGVLANDTDAESNPLTATLVTGTTHGILTLNANGGFTYAPSIGYFGSDSFTYLINDGITNATTPTVVTLAVNAVPNHLAFTQQPAGAVAGATLGPVTVDIEDAHGNVITTDNSTITLDTGDDSSLGGTVTLNAVAGVATFNNLSLTLAGSHTLLATDPGRATATSSAFTIAAAARAKLVVTRQPTTGPAGQALGSVAISVEDVFGNIVIADQSNVTITEQPIGTPSATPVLAGTTTVAAQNGVAVFSDLSITPAGAYALTASDADLLTAVTGTITTFDQPTIASVTPSISTKSKQPEVSIDATDTSSLGESGLTYTWSISKKPSGSKAVNFADSGTNTAKDTTARFGKAGTYHVQCLVTNADGHSVVATFSVQINQVATAFKLTPHKAVIARGASVQYSGIATDQFGHPMRTPATVTYAIQSGGGSITPDGLFTAGKKIGHVVFEIDVNGQSGTLGATIV